MPNKKLNIVILAAGKGSRMRSKLPKIMHCVGGKPMIQHVLNTVLKLYTSHIYIVHNLNEIPLTINDFITKNNLFNISIEWICQSQSLGTGHAVQQILPLLYSNGCQKVMILYADVPLVTIHTLKRLLSISPKNGIGLLTATLSNPRGYGRIIRNNNFEVIKIIEDKDANLQQYKIHEVNTGILVACVNKLRYWLDQITNNNSQNEFYLTDIVYLSWKEGCKINTTEPDCINEIKGINDKLELVEVERLYQNFQVKRLSLSGVLFADLNRFDLRGDLFHGQDVYIDTNVIIEGKVFLGNRVIIGTGCILKNVMIGDDVTIAPYSVIDNTTIDMNSVIGPFARLKLDSKLGESSKVGNFVEIKNSRLGNHSKVSHLSYIGDADVGSMVNIGAGTITCNYDGFNKNKTVIGDNVFIGSDSQLIAPIEIDKDAFIGAGTTVTQNVPKGKTIISRIKQFSIKRKKKILIKEK